MKLVVDTPERIVNIAEKFSERDDWDWCYFGIEMDRKNHFFLKMSAGKKHHYAKELNSIAHNLKTPFLDWISRLNMGRCEDVIWWSKQLPSKSVCQTDFFLFVCYFNLAKKWLTTNQFERTRLIAVEDPFLLKMLKDSFGVSEKNRIAEKILIKKFVISIFKFFFIRILFLSKYITLIFFDKLRKITNFRKYHDMVRFKPDILIYTWVEERCFKNKSFQDVYFNDLASLYSRNGYKTMLAVPVWLSARLKKRILDSNVHVVISSYFLSILDCLKTVLTIPPTYPNGNKKIFFGDDYTLLFSREYLLEITSMAFLTNLLEYYAYLNYFNSAKKIKLLIYPFENQPWEKMLILSSRKSRAVKKIVAYQHSSIPSLLLNYFIGKEEGAHMPLPDQIIANGEYHKKLFFASNYEGVDIENGGSLRYKEVLKFENKNVVLSSKKRILVLLPGVLSRAMEILYSIKRFKQRDDYEILIRLHPDLPVDKIKQLIIDIGEKVKIDETKNLYEVLSQTSAVVHAGTTAALEAYYKGLKVFKFMTELIDLDILSDLGLDQEEIEDFSEISFERQVLSHKEITNILVEPVKEKVWLSLIQKE